MKQLPAVALSLAASLTLFTAAMDPILGTELGLQPAGDATLGRTWTTAGTPTGTIMATAAKTTAISTTSSLNNGETAIPTITTIESQQHGGARCIGPLPRAIALASLGASAPQECSQINKVNR